jgi:UDPglucose 6-dehydrogenase
MREVDTVRVTIIGTGYVGLVTGVCLAHSGHKVTCVDIDASKVARMQQGEVPIYEPGLEPLFRTVLANGTLTVTTDLAAAVKTAEVVFLALPTPQGADGAADLSAVLAVADQLGGLLAGFTVVVTKSTVPVGTGDEVAKRIRRTATADFAVASNPEFLREGLAVEDCLHPDRIVIGTSSEPARALLHKLYAPVVERESQFVDMNVRSAELTKYAANSFLAMKVSFINEIANLSERLGTDVEAVRRGIGPDPRIGEKFLQAGIGYGGSCFPKDVEALLYTSKTHDYDFKLLESIVIINQSQKVRLIQKLESYFEVGLAGKRLALWGLAFKPDTDDVRESPALHMIPLLLEKGATVVAYDPHARHTAESVLGQHENLVYAETALEATQSADALCIVTEWDEFRTADLNAVRDSLAEPVIFDGRNLFEPADMKAAGFHYEAIGRASDQQD